MKKVLSVIASENFQEIEYLESKKAIESFGNHVITSSQSKLAHSKQGLDYSVDLLLSEVDTKDYDAVMFIGGPGSIEHFDDLEWHHLSQSFFQLRKITSAICAAPIILGRAGLLKGKRATCWAGLSNELITTGALYTASSLERDDLIITGDGPSSAYDFGLLVAKAL